MPSPFTHNLKGVSAKMTHHQPVNAEAMQLKTMKQEAGMLLGPSATLHFTFSPRTEMEAFAVQC